MISHLAIASPMPRAALAGGDAAYNAILVRRVLERRGGAP